MYISFQVQSAGLDICALLRYKMLHTRGTDFCLSSMPKFLPESLIAYPDMPCGDNSVFDSNIDLPADPSETLIFVDQRSNQCCLIIFPLSLSRMSSKVCHLSLLPLSAVYQVFARGRIGGGNSYQAPRCGPLPVPRRSFRGQSPGPPQSLRRCPRLPSVLL